MRGAADVASREMFSGFSVRERGMTRRKLQKAFQQS
jgi:hypothetical protein